MGGERGLQIKNISQNYPPPPLYINSKLIVAPFNQFSVQNSVKIMNFTFCGFSQKAPKRYFSYTPLWKAHIQYFQKVQSVFPCIFENKTFFQRQCFRLFQLQIMNCTFKMFMPIPTHVPYAFRTTENTIAIAETFFKQYAILTNWILSQVPSKGDYRKALQKTPRKFDDASNSKYSLLSVLFNAGEMKQG